MLYDAYGSEVSDGLTRREYENRQVILLGKALAPDMHYWRDDPLSAAVLFAVGWPWHQHYAPHKSKKNGKPAKLNPRQLSGAQASAWAGRISEREANVHVFLGRTRVLQKSAITSAVYKLKKAWEHVPAACTTKFNLCPWAAKFVRDEGKTWIGQNPITGEWIFNKRTPAGIAATRGPVTEALACVPEEHMDAAWRALREWIPKYT